MLNLGKDEHGETKSVALPSGLQEVEQEIAEHWFVKAHAQEITAQDVQSHALQGHLDVAVAELQALQAKASNAEQRIAEFEKMGREKDQCITDLQLQLAAYATKSQRSSAEDTQVKP